MNDSRLNFISATPSLRRTIIPFGLCSEVLSMHVRQRTSQTRRIQRGSPGAGVLGSDMWQLQNEVDGIKPKVEEILKPSSNEQLPYLSLLCDHFQEFVKVLHQPFNDAGSEPGYDERVLHVP